MTRSIRATESTPERIAAEHAVLARRVQRMTGELTTAATSRIEFGCAKWNHKFCGMVFRWLGI
ncbi:hypothetical protein GM51_11070 [freshwater metagenome]|uniref:Uncharacterized protein n=1 Tax=freshwater metagenome TaxID=449393 RepID=A0A094Q152_9ZZZZ